MSNKLTKVIRGMFMSLLKRSSISRTAKKEPKTKVLSSPDLELRKFNRDDYVNRKQDERAIEDLRSISKGLFVTGEKEGTQGVPSFDIVRPSATVQEWTAKCISLKKQILSQIDYKISEQKAIYRNLQDSLTESTREERIQYAISQLRWKKEKRWLRNPFKKRKIEQTYKEEIEQLIDLIKQEDAEIHDLIRNLYHQVYPKKNLTDYEFLYLISLLIITLGEFPLNVTSLQYLGEFSNIFVLILSGFFAIILGFTAHATGHAFFKKHTKEWIGALGIGLVVCAMIGILRSNMEGSSIMSLMNVLVFAFGILISYNRARNLAFWSSVRRKKKLQKKKNRIQTAWVKDIERYQPEAEREVREQEGDLRQVINSVGSAISSIEAYKTSIQHQIDGIYEAGVASYRNANTLSRLKAGHKPVLLWEKRQATEPDSSDNHNSSSTFFTYAQMIAVLIWLFGLTACGTSEPNEAVILFDVTDPVTIGSVEKDKIVPYLLEEVLELPDNVLQSQGLNVIVSSIGSTSIQYTETAKLEVGGSFLSRTEKTRKTDVGSFKEEVMGDIETIAKPSKELDKTVLMQNLCGHLNALAASNAPKKAILIFSDMLENTPQLSFYNYRNNPSQLLDHYETLAAKMDNVCPLPALNNITVTIIYLPTEETDGLFQASKTFWSKYLTGYGAEVIFSPNI